MRRHARYEAFMELMSNLEEGSTFYTKLSGMSSKFLKKVTDFCEVRKSERQAVLRDISEAAAAATVATPEPEPVRSSTANIPPAAPPARAGSIGLQPTSTPYSAGTASVHYGAPPTDGLAGVPPGQPVNYGAQYQQPDAYNPYAQQPAPPQLNPYGQPNPYGSASLPPQQHHPGYNGYAAPQYGAPSLPTPPPQYQPQYLAGAPLQPGPPVTAGIPGVQFATAPQMGAAAVPQRAGSGAPQWSCIACSFLNSGLLPNCEMCGTPRPAYSRTT